MLLSAGRLAPASLLLLLAAPPPAAQEEAPPSSPLLEDLVPGSGSVTFQLGLYDHADDGDGNPFLDEALTVIEPILLFDHDVSEDFGYGVELSYDFVSSASIDRLSNFPEQSGASRDNYIGADVSFRHRLPNDARLRWHAGYSDEYDYDSIGLGASLAWQPRGTDATVSLGLDGYHDKIDIIRFDGTEEGSDTRTSLTFNASWYQILDPKTHGELGASLAYQTGFLETPYNAVVLEDPALPPNPNLDNLARGTEFTEELPDDRTRLALFGKVRRQIATGRAWQLGGRLYGDTWGIYSVTLEPTYVHALIRDELYLELSYRFYVQTAADDFEESFLAPAPLPEFRTQDSDLGDFSASTVGFDVNWLKSKKSAIRFGANYALRSDGLDHVYGFVSWTRSF